MAESRDVEVASRLGRIEALLENVIQRLFGDTGDPHGGLIGNHEMRLDRFEKIFIRCVALGAAIAFLTGNGPVTLTGVLKLLSSIQASAGTH